MIQIEANIPITEDRTTYPFRDMEAGDSILFKGEKQAASARVAAIRFAKVHRPGWVFSMRKVENGWRLWRTE